MMHLPRFLRSTAKASAKLATVVVLATMRGLVSQPTDWKDFQLAPNSTRNRSAKFLVRDASLCSIFSFPSSSQWTQNSTVFPPALVARASARNAFAALVLPLAPIRAEPPCAVLAWMARVSACTSAAQAPLPGAHSIGECTLWDWTGPVTAVRRPKAVRARSFGPTTPTQLASEVFAAIEVLNSRFRAGSPSVTAVRRPAHGDIAVDRCTNVHRRPLAKLQLRHCCLGGPIGPGCV
mmetsp:Transcript_27673/g.54313  ORF Transcript_27673/g.54313 Transcript_27673/m.54313 type:complete len:236 (+) Transcript_27673:264-971(+)